MEKIRIPLIYVSEKNPLSSPIKFQAETGYRLHPAHIRQHRAVGVKRCSECHEILWVNEHGDLLTAVDFKVQKPWCDIKEEKDRVFVPRFYNKMELSTLTLWVSHLPLKGFMLHRAFKWENNKSGFLYRKGNWLEVAKRLWELLPTHGRNTPE